MTYSCSRHLVQAVRRAQKGLHKRVVVSPAECAVCDFCKRTQSASWVVNPE